MTATLDKFLFETNFDDAPPALPKAGPRPADPVPVPLYGAEDLAAARAEGQSEGYRQGLAEAEASREGALAASLASISNDLAGFAGELARLREDFGADSLHVARALVGKLFPHLAARHGLEEIEAVVMPALTQLADEPRLVLRVPDDQLDEIRRRIGQLAERQNFDGKLIFVGDPELALPDVRIEWAKGGIERVGADIWGQIDRSLAETLGGSNGEPASGAEESAPAADAMAL